MANEFKGIRLAKATFTPTTAGTYTSAEDFIPAGAIIKSITTVEGVALAGGTNVTFKVGSQSLTAAIALADFTGVDAHALTNADGLKVTSTGALNIVTTGTFSAGDITTYVEYFV
jgi:hypothetical protein